MRSKLTLAQMLENPAFVAYMAGNKLDPEAVESVEEIRAWFEDFENIGKTERKRKTRTIALVIDGEGEEDPPVVAKTKSAKSQNIHDAADFLLMLVKKDPDLSGRPHRVVELVDLPPRK